MLTEDEQHLHRVIIAQGDLREAIECMDAAAAINDPLDITRRALVCAALIYYARPFLENEHKNRKKRPPGAAASLIELSEEEWVLIIPDPERRALHSSMIKLRNKIVAHAASEFFTTVRHAEDAGYRGVRMYPNPDLLLLKVNATALLSYMGFRAAELTDRIETLRHKP